MTPAVVAGLAASRPAAALRGGRAPAAFHRGWSAAFGKHNALRRAAAWLGEALAPPPRLRREPLWGEALARLTAEPAAHPPPQPARRPAKGVLGDPDAARRPSAAQGAAAASAGGSRVEKSGQGDIQALRRPGWPGPLKGVAGAATADAGGGVGTKGVAAPRALSAAAPPRHASRPLLERLAGPSPLVENSWRAETPRAAAPPTVRRLPAPAAAAETLERWRCRLAREAQRALRRAGARAAEGSASPEGTLSREGAPPTPVAANPARDPWRTSLRGPAAPPELLASSPATHHSPGAGGPTPFPTSPVPPPRAGEARGPRPASLPAGRAGGPPTQESSGAGPWWPLRPGEAPGQGPRPGQEPRHQTPGPPGRSGEPALPAPRRPGVPDLQAPAVLRPRAPEGLEAGSAEDDLGRLAARMRRILAEEARRYGVDV